MAVLVLLQDALVVVFKYIENQVCFKEIYSRVRDNIDSYKINNNPSAPL